MTENKEAELQALLESMLQADVDEYPNLHRSGVSIRLDYKADERKLSVTVDLFSPTSVVFNGFDYICPEDYEDEDCMENVLEVAEDIIKQAIEDEENKD